MGRAHEKSSQSMLLFLMQKNQITCIKNEVMVILLIEKVIDNKMFPKSTAGLYISDSYQRNFISHRHRIFYGLCSAIPVHFSVNTHMPVFAAMRSIVPLSRLDI